MTDVLETLTAALDEIEADVRGDPVGRRWDNPRLMLNMVAGARAIVALHEPFECSNVRCPTGLHCRTCAPPDDDAGVDFLHSPCPTITALAAMFAAEPEQATEARA